MAKIGLSNGFSLIPKGMQVFKIVDVNYKEDFGKMEITLQTAKGQKHVERFSLLDKNGEANQGALNAFSYFAKTAMNDYSLEEIDHEDLVGCFIKCDVDYEEVESNRNPGRMVKFVRLGDKEPADGFEEDVVPPRNVETAKNEAPKAEKKGFNLDDILG